MLATIIITGCVSSGPDRLEKWIGKNQHDLIVEWGPPAKREDDGADGQILIYEYVEDRGVKPGEITTDVFGNTKVTPPQERKRIHATMFFVHFDGTIYAWKRDTKHVGPIY
jgi:hypothetical protein